MQKQKVMKLYQNNNHCQYKKLI